MRALILLVGGLFASLVFAKPTADLDSITRGEISERLAPVGFVCLAGEECASAAGVVASSSSGPRSGDAVYNQFCVACHGSGLLGAPKKDDAAAWQAAEKTAGGFSSLLSNAINGIRSMPAKGTCMDCSDEEISIAIEYMSGLKP
ncbi:c-type cytochrome [Endozoicomonas sp. GU-1]|uniref:c-type cytochrome n=1 Tax=Endozoicomonas sp. GU-1 TaxID=3009078 RepID=UPI0022B5613B|nr:c-type cytochrome [Endozoicomonas sp. GU-1]WBA82585.1 c-type cytochrome [Endozoicomonas sp. GU-1]WBA85514.1 c-type cytochrome [Endozoicomonas sp. GU-1]